MTGRYKAYSEYKESGIDWIGVIPVSWSCLPIKRSFEVVNGSTPRSGEKLYWDGDITWVTPADLSKVNESISTSSKTITNEGLSSCGTSLVPKGSLILSTRAPIGTIAIASKELCTNQGCKSLIKTTSVENKYVYYVLSISGKQLNNLGRGTTFLELSTDELANYRVPNPSIQEQQKIANFLDHETAKIDTLIAKQEKLIELLKEKRQAVISHAVTKGLNPDVPMKDSGVEWLGDVPEHWEVGALNYSLEAIGDVDHFMPPSREAGVPYVMTGDLQERASEISFEHCKQVSHEDYLRLSRRIKTSIGDVIMARYATIGTVSYVDIDKPFLVSYSCVTLKPNTNKVFGLYLYYYFKSLSFLQGVQSHINTNTQGNVGVSDLKTVKVPLPTLNEQEMIINHLNLTLDKIDNLSKKASDAIELMKERKTALISAVVTGKIDLREWQESA
ncbi:TPA: restriction endonuclease subunit S [Vibrio parahaemolyticus]|uniref:restriction endonuclease subunit S n=1 Tax=Vibrio parahaemolyticus TaxID=670 RepID=UPI001110F9E5|nr:restriction endonuclease subunit S [Vibrio parahaemolyticus]MBE3910255.1 restriction endonuclease subunit S [Vibrio parahaemolyticus]TMX39256.1 restriction endonuclease subunit S [Vibrio parahaemolyticus]TMX78740.1 restriction endonuclease subunit S [Vibrio parahaemolyticus]HCE1512224.1 restriction endonuclease subunit S [Vibrio parahaemolyticus]HCG6120359.1 restriction endonuclease subunit S [Vibrio parahaemolyticus]